MTCVRGGPIVVGENSVSDLCSRFCWSGEPTRCNFGFLVLACVLREAFFNFRDKNEIFFLSVSCLETRMRREQESILGQFPGEFSKKRLLIYPIFFKLYVIYSLNLNQKCIFRDDNANILLPISCFKTRSRNRNMKLIPGIKNFSRS